MVIRKARVSPGREDKNKFLGAFVLHGGLEAKDLPFQEAVPLCPGPWVGVEVERWQVVTQKGTGLRTLGKGAGDGWAKGKSCGKALTLTKKGTISMTMASFRSGFSMGFSRATCKNTLGEEEETAHRAAQPTGSPGHHVEQLVLWELPLGEGLQGAKTAPQLAA